MPIHDWTRVNAGTFHDFHTTWLIEIKRALNAGLLPPDYYALAEQIAGGLHPDVLTLASNLPAPKAGKGNGALTPGSAGGGLLLAAAPPRVRFTATAEPEQYARKRKAIAIRHINGDHVVAILEIVSPGNKAGRHPLRAFVDKAVELLDAGIHLLILDLFPPGPRDPQGIHAAIWSEISDAAFELPADKPLTLAAYVASAMRTAYVEPVAVGDELPDMPLFLEPDFYVPVPLEATYRTAFEAVPRRWRDELAPPSTTTS